MTSRTIKRSSMLLVIAGILIAGSILFHPSLSRPDYALRVSWAPVHFLFGAAALMEIFGLAGLYSVMRTKITVFGQWAFGLAIVGSVLMAGLMLFIETALLPVLARNPVYGTLLDPDSPLMTGSFGWMVTGSLLMAAIGWVFLALYLMGTKTVSVINGLFLLAGAPLLLFSPPFPFAIMIIGGLLLGAGIAWLGFSIRKGAAHEALKESLRLADECFIQAGGHA